MSVIVTGTKELGTALLAMAKQQSEATRIANGRAAHFLERAIKAKLSVTDSTGEEKRDSKGRFQKRERGASLPGEPPHLQSGDLRRSVQVDGPESLGLGRWYSDVGPTIIYARIQELGGEAGHAILPARPYVAPALDESIAAMRTLYLQAWRAAMRG